jgi:5-methylcytosine-specific restriction endonuclease McrA
MRISDPFKTAAAKTRETLTPTMRNKIKEAVGKKCEYDGKKYSMSQLEVHHLSEVGSSGGPVDKNTPGNLIVLCRNCHGKAHAQEITKSKFREKIRKRSDKVKKEIASILRKRTKVREGDDPIRDINRSMRRLY